VGDRYVDVGKISVNYLTLPEIYFWRPAVAVPVIIGYKSHPLRRPASARREVEGPPITATIA
jgi:hypothetical protein